MRREPDHEKIARSRCCGVCRSFRGSSIHAEGDCVKHAKRVQGRASAAACEQWARRIEGVDPLPWDALPAAAMPASIIEGPALVAAVQEPTEIEKAFEALRPIKVDRQEKPVPETRKPPAKLKREPTPARPVVPRSPTAAIKVEARRDRLRALVQVRGAITATAAASELELPKWQVRGDAKAIGIVLAISSSRYDPAVAMLREKVRSAFDGKRTIREIAELVGAHVRTVRGHLDALKLKAPAGRPGLASSPDTKAKIEARREIVREYVQRGGHTKTQIAAAAGISERTLLDDFRAIGIEWAPVKIAKAAAPVIDLDELRAQRRERVDLLADAGDMIRLARNTSAALIALADRLEEFMRQIGEAKK